MCTTGSRFSSAISSARMILRVVIGYQAPPFSELSFGDHHHLAAADHADAGDEQRLRRLAVVVPVGRERHQLEERGAAVEQQVDPLADGQLVLLGEPVERALGALVARLSSVSRSSAASARLCSR